MVMDPVARNNYIDPLLYTAGLPVTDASREAFARFYNDRLNDDVTSVLEDLAARGTRRQASSDIRAEVARRMQQYSGSPPASSSPTMKTSATPPPPPSSSASRTPSPSSSASRTPSPMNARPSVSERIAQQRAVREAATRAQVAESVAGVTPTEVVADAVGAAAGGGGRAPAGPGPSWKASARSMFPETYNHFAKFARFAPALKTGLRVAGPALGSLAFAVPSAMEGYEAAQLPGAVAQGGGAAAGAALGAKIGAFGGPLSWLTVPAGMIIGGMAGNSIGNQVAQQMAVGIEDPAHPMHGMLDPLTTSEAEKARIRDSAALDAMINDPMRLAVEAEQARRASVDRTRAMNELLTQVLVQDALA